MMERKYTLTIKATENSLDVVVTCGGDIIAYNRPRLDTTLEDSLNRIGMVLDETWLKTGDLPLNQAMNLDEAEGWGRR